MVKEPCSQLTTKDHAILQTMLERYRGPNGPYRRLLEQKARSSAICFRDDIPPGVVTLNTRLTYRINGVLAGPHVVVQSEGAALPDFALSIHTIHGLALLGLEEGESIAIRPEQGMVEAIEVDSVLSQPEAEARLRDAVKGVAPRGDAPPHLPPADDDDPGPKAA